MHIERTQIILQTEFLAITHFDAAVSTIFIEKLLYCSDFWTSHTFFCAAFSEHFKQSFFFAKHMECFKYLLIQLRSFLMSLSLK